MTNQEEKVKVGDAFVFGGVVGVAVVLMAWFLVAMLTNTTEINKSYHEMRRELDATDRTAHSRYEEQKRDSKSLESLHLRIRDIEDHLDREEEKAK